MLSLCFLAGATADLVWEALELGCVEASGKCSLSRILQETPHTSISLRGTEGVTPYRVPPLGRFPVRWYRRFGLETSPWPLFFVSHVCTCTCMCPKEQERRSRTLQQAAIKHLQEHVH